jgi:hypothetical protein
MVALSRDSSVSLRICGGRDTPPWQTMRSCLPREVARYLSSGTRLYLFASGRCRMSSWMQDRVISIFLHNFPLSTHRGPFSVFVLASYLALTLVCITKDSQLVSNPNRAGKPILVRFSGSIHEYQRPS